MEDSFIYHKIAASNATNYEIGHSLKSIQVIDSFSRPVFKDKECNEAIICILRSQKIAQNPKLPPFGATLIPEALYFSWSFNRDGTL